MRNRIKLLLLAAAGMITPAGLLMAVGVQPASAAGPATAPSGTVSFTSSGPGVFSATQCTLSGSGTLASSCTVYYAAPPGAPMRGQTITASYGGDNTHQGSTGSATLK